MRPEEKIKEDYQAWNKYPNLRWTFNKLELSLRLGYDCGPSGTNVSNTGEYCVRPIYNLGGMGVGASFVFFNNNTDTIIPAGYFWCERFYGNHLSIDFIKKNKKWTPIFACQGFREDDDPLYQFNRWKKIQIPNIKLPDFIEEIDSKELNIEFIGNKIIEIHLRHGSDFPENATEIIPVWENKKYHQSYKDWQYIENKDNSDNNLPNTRLGFYYR